jgi:transcriptional regulator with XRE-family HTH domain
MSTELGKWLADLRQNKGISQEALAIMLGKGQSDIAKMESGTRKITFFEVLEWVGSLGYNVSEVQKMVVHFFPGHKEQTSFWNQTDD